MSAVSSWLLSITCMILLSVLSEFVLPEGQINKYTKAMFSFCILLVIIMPLPKLFGKDFDFSKYFGSQTNLQENYLEQVNLDKLNALQEDLSNSIQDAGLKNVVVSINANIFAENLEIYSCFVDLRDIEFLPNFKNKDKVSAKLKILDLIDGYDLLKNVEVKFDE